MNRFDETIRYEIDQTALKVVIVFASLDNELTSSIGNLWMRAKEALLWHLRTSSIESSIWYDSYTLLAMSPRL